MHYEIQCLAISNGGRSPAPDRLIEAAKEMQARLKECGFSVVIEANDLRAGRRLFRSVDATGL